MLAKFKTLVPFVLSSIVIIGCSGRTITVSETYNVLRPVKQLELPEQVQENLIVQIDNVADEGSSYKNHVELYINDKKILPEWLVSNVENIYTFSMRVRPGYYDVKAVYYAYIGWGEEKYTIESQDLIKVYSDKITKAYTNIVKKPNGEPVNKKMFFSQSHESISAKDTPKSPTQF